MATAAPFTRNPGRTDGSIGLSMLAGVRHILMSPATGAFATASAFGLAVALGIAASGWEVQRKAYEVRIVELSAAADLAKADLRTELTACHAATRAQQIIVSEVATREASSGAARQLLTRRPEGIDACARMESADRAVLSNLGR